MRDKQPFDQQSQSRIFETSCALRYDGLVADVAPVRAATSVAVAVDAVRGVDVEDRRRPTLQQRLSWAAHTPFITGGQPLDDALVTVPAPRRAGRLLRPRLSWQRRLVALVVAIDVVVAMAVAVAVASTGRSGPLALPLIMVASALAWSAAMALHGGYRVRRLGAGPDEFQSILRAAVTLVAILGVSAYATQTMLARRWVLVAIPLVVVADGVGRYLMRRWLHRQRGAGRAMLRTLVVGHQDAAQQLMTDLSREPFHGYDVVGVCPPRFDGSVGRGSPPVMGSLSDVPQAVHDHDIDVVVVTGGVLSGPALRRLWWALEKVGADLVVSPGLLELSGPQVTLRPTAGLSLVHLERPDRRLGRTLGKAVLDRTLGAVMLVVAVPVVAVCALAVVLTDPGPAFFRQKRVGLDGRTFTMWKLRSMVADAERLRQELEARSDRDGLMFKMHADPRVTPVGRVLRRFSFDELPQLWNVVKGDMSLVGPRPPLLREVEQYHDAVHRRLRVKPGLTGLWQVSGRADLDWEQSVQLDLRYVDNWSLAMDLLILWKTFRVVARGSGAY